VRLEGLHHITAITGDAPRNVDFYARVLGLRLIKKTVNFDAPEVYHLYYGDEAGSPGSVLTFFEFPDAAPGQAGAGMVHQILWRVRGEESLEFWAEHLAGEGVPSERTSSALRFRDFEGLEYELAASGTGGEQAELAAESAEIPSEHAILGFEGVRAYSAAPERSAALLTEALEFEGQGSGDRFQVQSNDRSAVYAYDPPPPERPVQGAGTVHHVAWASHDEDHEELRRRVDAAGAHPTPVIDRDYFLSIYFREPSGVLFEIATMSPGFAVDEPPENLGQSLMLPAQHEPRRAELERTLTPIVNPRAPSAS